MTVTEAAKALAAARVRFASAFIRWRLRAPSDGQAEQHAIIETNSEITEREAELRMALWSLEAEMWRESDVTPERSCACAHGGSANEDDTCL